jgi:hypothetical protein
MEEWRYNLGIGWSCEVRFASLPLHSRGESLYPLNKRLLVSVWTG